MDSIYKLTDGYSLFYTKFIEHTKFKGPGTWERFSAGAAWKSWSGIAFESVRMKYEAPLKIALDIASVHTEVSIWRHRPAKGERGTPD